MRPPSFSSTATNHQGNVHVVIGDRKKWKQLALLGLGLVAGACTNCDSAYPLREDQKTGKICPSEAELEGIYTASDGGGELMILVQGEQGLQVILLDSLRRMFPEQTNMSPGQLLFGRVEKLEDRNLTLGHMCLFHFVFQFPENGRSQMVRPLQYRREDSHYSILANSREANNCKDDLTLVYYRSLTAKERQAFLKEKAPALP